MRKRRDNPEERLHIAVAQYLAFALYPPTFWSSIDHGAGKMARASAGLRKARGVRAGLPDILIVHPLKKEGSIVVGLELKSRKGVQSPAQRRVNVSFTCCNALYEVCRSIDDVQAALNSIGIPIRATSYRFTAPLVRVARHMGEA